MGQLMATAMVLEHVGERSAPEAVLSRVVAADCPCPVSGRL